MDSNGRKRYVLRPKAVVNWMVGVASYFKVSRGWSIRAKIMTLAVVPLVAIAGLAIFGVAVTAAPALNLLEAIAYSDGVGDPGELLMVELQKERRISVSGNPGATALVEQRLRTDEFYQRFKAKVKKDNVRSKVSAGHMRLVDAFVSVMDTVPQLRKDYDVGKTDAGATVRRYSGVIDSAYEMFAPLQNLSDPELVRIARGIFAVSRARELLAREDAIVASALVDRRILAAEHSQILRAIGARRFQQDEAASLLSSPYREQYERIFAGKAFSTLYAMEESLGMPQQKAGALPIDATVWRNSADAVLKQMDETEDAAALETVVRGNKVAVAAFATPIVAGLLGLLCAAAALTLALRTGRSVVRRLERLRVSALEVANERLPQAVAALRQPGGAYTDAVLFDVPMVAVGTDEVGQVGHAFSAVQRVAIRAAVDEATLRRGLSEVFLNIARRSQALLHRQLTLLDKMERRTTTPQELEDLFRLDHMATRMRRHAEALVILAGAAPGRGWRHPVPVIDVVRGATSEIEEYVRVGVSQMPQARVVGRAVGDLIHILAELLENATSYAPPHTRVLVTAEIVGNGLALQVEDRGLGMSDDELLAANARLINPPQFDPANSARLGLLVVAKLAARQGISVRLRQSPYGGITAVVLVPSELVITSAEVAAAKALPAKEIEPTAEPLVGNMTRDEQTLDIANSTEGGLPKRVRRAQPAAEAADVPAEEPDVSAQTDVPVRGAEQVRAMMSAFQTGTARGRAQAVTAHENDDEIGA